MGAGIENDDSYIFTTDNYGYIEVDYEAGFAAKTIIFRARDQVTGDVGFGYCTSYIEAQAQVEQYRLLRAREQKYTFSLSANPEWLTADGVSTAGWGTPSFVSMAIRCMDFRDTGRTRTIW